MNRGSFGHKGRQSKGGAVSCSTTVGRGQRRGENSLSRGENAPNAIAESGPRCSGDAAQWSVDKDRARTADALLQVYLHMVFHGLVALMTHKIVGLAQLRQRCGSCVCAGEWRRYSVTALQLAVRVVVRVVG